MTIRKIAWMVAAVIGIAAVWMGVIYVKYAVHYSGYMAELRGIKVQFDQINGNCPPGVHPNTWNHLVGTTYSLVAQSSGFEDLPIRTNPPRSRSSYEQLRLLNQDLKQRVALRKHMTEEDMGWIYDRTESASPFTEKYGKMYRSEFEGLLRAAFHRTESEEIAEALVLHHLEVRHGIEAELIQLSQHCPPGTSDRAWTILVGGLRAVLGQTDDYNPLTNVASVPTSVFVWLHQDLRIRIAAKKSLSEEDFRWMRDRIAKTNKRAEEYAEDYRHKFEDPLRWVFHPQPGDAAEYEQWDSYYLAHHMIETELESLLRFRPAQASEKVWGMLEKCLHRILLHSGGLQQTTLEELVAFHKDVKQKLSEKRFQEEDDIRWIFNRIAAMNSTTSKFADQSKSDFDDLVKQAFHPTP